MPRRCLKSCSAEAGGMKRRARLKVREMVLKMRVGRYYHNILTVTFKIVDNLDLGCKLFGVGGN